MTTTAAAPVPYDEVAEADLVGALLATPAALGEVLQLVGPEDCWVPKHRDVFRAIVDLSTSGEPIDDHAVARRSGLASDVLRLRAGCGPPSHVLAYAQRVAGQARFRRLQGAGVELAEAIRRGDPEGVEVARKVIGETDLVTDHRSKLLDGASWLAQNDDRARAVWGSDGAVLAARGEPTILTGPSGVGKTTVVQQFALARVGVVDRVLGWPVERGAGRVLYLACDRPEQARQSMERMVRPEDLPLLAERLRVWKGPPPADFARQPTTLLDLARAAGADTAIVDSIKDVAGKLSDEEVGSGLNRCFQLAVSNGVEVMALHHHRKSQAGNKKPSALDDVFGSNWITAGAGSVLMLWGAAGDLVVTLEHLKHPASPIGPLQIEHDHELGASSILRGPADPLTVLRAAVNGITAPDLALLWNNGDRPGENEIRKARRSLERLTTAGLAHRSEAGKGGPGGTPPVRYYPVDNRLEEAP